MIRELDLPDEELGHIRDTITNLAEKARKRRMRRTPSASSVTFSQSNFVPVCVIIVNSYLCAVTTCSQQVQSHRLLIAVFQSHAKRQKYRGHFLCYHSYEFLIVCSVFHSNVATGGPGDMLFSRTKPRLFPTYPGVAEVTKTLVPTHNEGARYQELDDTLPML